MLIRFVVKNYLSFKDQTEFNLIPSRVTRLNHHKYVKNDIEILKMSALYGANGSGKSNLIKSISSLRNIVLDGTLSSTFFNRKFKLDEENKKQSIEFAIEFYSESAFYYYSIEFDEGIILKESLSTFNSSKEKDELVFERTSTNNASKIGFPDQFYSNAENTVLKNVIEKDLLKTNQPLLALLNTLSNLEFDHAKNAFKWFKEKLIIIFPKTRHKALANLLDSDDDFYEFANDLMASFNTGIQHIKVESKNADDFFGDDRKDELNELLEKASNNPTRKSFGYITHKSTGERINIVRKEGQLLAQSLLFEHSSNNSVNVEFKYEEESDGTLRLLEYIPALHILVNQPYTIIIDEIERSIHPITIKEIISKFSAENDSQGQLVFSTHESNLLDQSILRTDEIWFSEKNVMGSTKLYSLSDYKEHNTIDIQKGYLSGRYGAIPFLGNFKDLSWNI